MEFLDKIVLHQSAHHMELIKYLLILTHFIFIGYTSLLFGSLLLSYLFKKKFEKTEDSKYKSAIKKYIDLATFNKGASFTFAIIPILSAMFGYSQLLHLSNINITFYFLLTVLFLFIALLFIYSFKYSVHLKDIFTLAENYNSQNEELKSEVENFKSSTSILYSKSSFYGLLFLIMAVYFYSIATQLAIDFNNSESNKSIINEIFSINAFTYFLIFVNFSFIITSLTFLYKYFRNNSTEKFESEEIEVFFKNFSLKILLSFSVILPLLLTLNIFSKPLLSFSSNYFLGVAIFFLMILFVISLSYLMLKENKLKYVSSISLLFSISLFLFVINEQSSFSTSTKSHFVYLSNEYENYEKNLKEVAGLVKVTINGADIYNGKCIACHQFDRKVVGPPYNSVVPKYEGKKDQLVKFILNPVKVNPEYPSMPNQGLKPNEAEAVADFLLANYKKK